MKEAKLTRPATTQMSLTLIPPMLSTIPTAARDDAIRALAELIVLAALSTEEVRDEEG